MLSEASTYIDDISEKLFQDVYSNFKIFASDDCRINETKWSV